MRRALSLLLALLILSAVSAAFAAGSAAVQSISLDVTEATVAVDRKISLKVTVEPRSISAGQLEWTSSDEDVATVKNGHVYGISAGTAVITAAAKDGSGISASVTVTVVVPVKKIIPEESHLALPAGVGWELYWTVLPVDASDKSVVWKSNNEQIATVNEDGVVFTHRNGYCWITGFAADGSGVKASVDLTVKDHEIMITEPGQVEVNFETADEVIISSRIVKGVETTVKTNRYFSTEKGLVSSPSDMVLMPLKAGSDTISMQFIEKRKTVRIDKHPVFIARNAVGEAAVYTEDGKAGPIRFLSLPWGSSYPEVKEILEFRGRNVRSIVQSNADLRSMLEGEVQFGDLTAYSAALNYSYDAKNRMYEVKNSLFKGDLYFNPSIPFGNIVKTAKRVYSLTEGEESEEYCAWERDHVKVTLTRKDRYTELEVTWDGTPVETEEDILDKIHDMKEREEERSQDQPAETVEPRDYDEDEDEDWDEDEDEDEDYDNGLMN